MEKRVVFPKGKQKEFLREARNDLQVTWPEFAKLVKTNRKTLKSYEYELCRLPYRVLKDITAIINTNTENEVLEKYNAKIVDFDGSYYYIALNGYERLKKFNELIGWNNAKHQEKIKKWKKQYPELSKDIIVSKTIKRLK